ncbi:UNVERIFIED_CONTAM: hypothetical protein K2H54_038363 [Gekko kuhli]
MFSRWNKRCSTLKIQNVKVFKFLPRAGSEPPAKKAKKKKKPQERSLPLPWSKPVDSGSETLASTRRHHSPSIRNRHSVDAEKPSTSRGCSPRQGLTPPVPCRHRSPSAPRLRTEPSPSLEIFRQDRSWSPDVLLLEPESPPQAFDPLEMPPPWFPSRFQTTVVAPVPHLPYQYGGICYTVQ